MKIVEFRLILPGGEIVATTTEENPTTAERVISALPIESDGNTWGEEIYFSTGLVISSENPRTVVNKGDIAFWPPGKALCIFFGPTPASRGNEIRPASAVNVFARIKDFSDHNYRILLSFQDGDKISVVR